jgi:hypothetical protein
LRGKLGAMGRISNWRESSWYHKEKSAGPGTLGVKGRRRWEVGEAGPEQEQV